MGRTYLPLAAKLRADPVLAEFFSGSDVGGLKTHQRMFLTAAFGGPDAYEGRDAGRPHAPHHHRHRLRRIHRPPHRDPDGVQVAGERATELVEILDPLRHEIVHGARGVAMNDDPAGGRGGEAPPANSRI